MHNNNLNKSITVFNALLTAVVVLVAVFLVLSRVDKFLKIQAVDQCGKVATYQKNLADTKVTAPLGDVYKTCLKDKGY